MDDDRWIRPPAPGAAWRWRERRHGIELVCIWHGVWHNPGARTHHAMWLLPHGDTRFAEALAEWADPIGPVTRR